MSLFAGLEPILTENVPLSQFTWFKIGGPARYFLQPTSDDQLRTIIRRCREHDVPWRILGHGANLLVDDNGVDCAVIRLDEASFGRIELSTNGDGAVVGAAASLGQLVLDSVRQGLRGAEVLAGIPGTLGGAVKVNAGGRYGDIGTVTSKVRVLDGSGETFEREKPDLSFEYRRSNVFDQIITAVHLELVPDDPARLLNRMREVWIVKKASQPLASRSAGCVFKNPSPDQSAGALIDKAGLKGTTIGGAAVSEQHANFIVVQSEAKFSDVTALIDLIQSRIADKFDTQLDLEIEIWKD